MRAALAALAVLATLAAPGAAAGTLSDPRDVDSGPADLRTVAWTVRDADADVVLEAWSRPDTSSFDYVAVLMLGNASRDAPAESYYLAKSLSGGSVAIAQHANKSSEPLVSLDAERLRFKFSRVLPAEPGDVNCTFAAAGTGHFSQGVQVVDSAPDGGSAGEGDPWRLRTQLCAPPRPQPTPGPEAALLALCLAGASLAARRRRA